MTDYNHSGNAVVTTITAPIDDNDLGISLASSTGWPSATFWLILCDALDPSERTAEEHILCDSRSSTTVTVNGSGRGADSTSARSWAAGSFAFHGAVATEYEDYSNHVADATKHLGAGTISSASYFAAGVVDAAAIATDAVDSAEIKAGAVGAAELATDAVTTVKILDSNVTAGKLASDAVTTVKILDANVTAGKLATNAVTTVKITDANVTLAKLAADSVDGTKIADDSIDSEHYVAQSIDAEHYSPLSVDTSTLANNAVTTAKIGDGNVTGAKLAEAYHRGRQQAITTNSAPTGLTIQHGWGYKQGATTSEQATTVTFPVAFASAPLWVGATHLAASNSTPTAISDFTNEISGDTPSIMISDITASTMKVSQERTGNYSNTLYYGFTWMAIGTV